MMSKEANLTHLPKLKFPITDQSLYVERDFMDSSCNSAKRVSENDNFDGISGTDKKLKFDSIDLSLGLSSSNDTQNNVSNDFSGNSLSVSYTNQFSHNLSCSGTRNSSEMWNGGEGTNGSVHSRFRPVGGESDSNVPFFPSELVAVGGNGASDRPGKMLEEIASESIPVMAKVMQELTDEMVESVKEYLRKLITVNERKDELVRLQLRLERRLDLTKENLLKANKNQLEILVSIRTSLEVFLSVGVPVSEMIEVFLYERCKNVKCKRLVPVEDCECKICSMTKGFCSECMCPVCLNFDSANNTCSWVGCDVCSHWCHAACGLKKNLIKTGPSLKGPAGTTEVQFHCMGCGHASEMFGFIKDVFKSCAEEWSLETLRKELECVWKMFRGSSDFKGKELHLKAGEIILKLDNKAMSSSDVCIFMLQFFNYTDIISEFPASNSPPTNVPPSIPYPQPTSFYNWGTLGDREGPMLALHDPPRNNIKPPMINGNSMMIKDEWSVKSTKKDVFDSVESLVRIKQAEARMFQNKADEARKEVEAYKRIIRINIENLDEEYATKIAKLCLNESEERKKQKIEEFKVVENGHVEYYKMKVRMQAEIAGLLQRMENTKKQWV